jgi:O-antigen ligase
MSEARAAPPWALRWLTPLLLGAYAAAIAVAPTLRMALILAAPLAAVPLAWWVMLKTNRWLLLFFAAALLLPPLPLAFGNSGPHPAVILVPFGILAGLLKRGGWRVPDSRLNRALIVLPLILLASVAEAAFFSGAAVALGSLARVVLFAISVYVFFYAAYGPGAGDGANPFGQLRLLYGIAVLAALFACVDFYFQFPPPAGFGPQYIWLRSGVYRRAQGLFYEASTLGNFCAFFLVMMAAALVRRQRPVSRPALLAGGLIFATALVLSFSRASLVNLLVAAAVLLYLHRPRLRLGRALPAAALAGAAGLLLLRALFPAFASAYWMRLEVTVRYFFSATEGLLSGRVASWRTVLDFLAHHPWLALFGIGYKTLPYSTYLGHTVITDNMYLSLLAETGIAGLAAMLWLSIEILRAARRAAASRDAQRSFFGSWMLAFWAAQMVQMLSSDLLTYWRVMPLYFWVLALAVRHERPVP